MANIPDDHLTQICKYRQGECTCKYIFYVLSLASFCCGKLVEDMKQRVDTDEGMIAKGDNCPGLK